MTHTKLWIKPQSTKYILLKSSMQFGNVICEPSVHELILVFGEFENFLSTDAHDFDDGDYWKELAVGVRRWKSLLFKQHFFSSCLRLKYHTILKEVNIGDQAKIKIASTGASAVSNDFNIFNRYISIQLVYRCVNMQAYMLINVSLYGTYIRKTECKRFSLKE